MKYYYVRWSERTYLLNPGTNWFFRVKTAEYFGRIKYTLGILGLQIWFLKKIK